MDSSSIPTRADTRRRHIPDVPVTAHTGERLRFYTDLVRDRVVLINFISLADPAASPATANLATVARALGPRLGDEIGIISLAVDPANERPDALARFAAALRAPPGWRFLTGASPVLDVLRAALFRHGAGATEAEDESRRDALRRLRTAFADDPRALLCRHPPALQDCARGLVRYGNDAADIWGSVPARAAPDQILARLDWVRSRPASQPDRPLRRGGPWPVSAHPTGAG
jgi:hypothetical protein